MSKIEGIAAVFYHGGPGEEVNLATGDSSRYATEPNAVERFHRSAFDRVLGAGLEITCDIEHDGRLTVATTADGTLRLWLSEIGLHYAATLPALPWVPLWCERIRRERLAGSSISFVAREVRRFSERGRRIVEVLTADLLSVGPVTTPAYTATTARLIEDAAESRREADRVNGLIAAGELC